ncbi:hypothetical protein DFJ63DRAFT_109197 [Scheffersomyces coipomensis]|uniref:uncharacterized protein n=1 Tax=Scheffersomyces coipomensis TaxID=1788519 RepID=UPI00315D7EDB
MAKIQMIKKDFKINDVSDLEKVGHIVKCIFTKEKQPKRYDDFENKTPEDFKMSGYKTKEVNASSKRSIHAKLPSINKLFSTLPPIHAPNNGTSQMLFKSALVQQFKYKYYHLKSFRNSMYMHSINLVKFLEVQIQYCEHWQALLEDNDVSVDARYIKSMYSSFHSKLVNQLKYSHESIITTIQRVVIPALDSGLKACKQFNDKLNRYYNIKDHENGTTLAKLHDELQHHIPPFIHQLDQLVELSLMKFHTAYCRWNETIIGNRSLDEYRKLSSKEKSSGEKHDDICKYYKSVAPPIT